MKLYRAVVENNNDPKKQSRVQVRIFGIHTEDNEFSSKTFSTVKTSDLPWSEVMGGNQFGLISGVGVSSVLRNGTWVWVFLNDNNVNKPIIMGTIVGNNSKKRDYDSGEGFSDPDGVYPLENKKVTPMTDDRTSGTVSSRLNKTDIHPLLDSKYQTLATLETESGHIIELDDTPGDERVKVTHRTGSFILIDKNGDILINGVRDVQYNISRNVNWNIGGDLNITTVGAQMNTNGGNYSHSAPRIDLN